MTHKIPANCGVIKAPKLDEALTEKGFIDKHTKNDNDRLSDIQNLIATAALGQLANELNDAVAWSKDQKGNVNGAVFAILGMAQQKLPQRRMFEIAKFLLKDIAGIATANIQTGSEPFCGQDVKRLMSNARNTYTSSDQSKQWLPYKRRGQRCQPQY